MLVEFECNESLKVQEKELKEYLIDMQAQGYTIVAVEQTINSQNLYQYAFPEKTLLLLGYSIYKDNLFHR